jgi:hypothetical protein
VQSYRLKGEPVRAEKLLTSDQPATALFSMWLEVLNGISQIAATMKR